MVDCQKMMSKLVNYMRKLNIYLELNMTVIDFFNEFQMFSIDLQFTMLINFCCISNFYLS